MGRRVRRFLIIIPPAAVALLSLFLITCSNEFDIFEAIKTEMKMANDLFLEVKSYSPSNNALDINPSDPILIEFDRAIDESTLNITNIMISKVGGTDPSWVPIPNNITKTLTINPDPYFDGLSQYLVTITKGVKGEDGSDLQEELSWSFWTKNYPGGTVYFDSGDKPYFTSSPKTLTINLNDEVTKYRCVIISEGDDEVFALNSATWVVQSGPVNTTTSVAVSPGSISDGYKRAYIQVSNDSGDSPNPSYDRSFMDVNDPIPSIDTWPATVTASSSATQNLVASALDGSGSGIDTTSYAWSVSRLSGSGSLTLGNSGTLTPSLYDNGTSADGTFRLEFAVDDLAGRNGSTTQDVTWDRTAPSLTISGPDYDLTSPLSWSWSTSATDIDHYTYSWNGITYYNLGTSTSINKYPAASDYGPHVLYLKAYDDIGNVTYETDTIYYSPDIYPRWGQHDVPTGAFTFQWPDYSGMYTYYYDFYIYRYKLDPVPRSPVAPGLSISELPVPKGTLELDKRYLWFYKVYHLGKGGIRISDFTSDTYTFWTE